LAREFFRERVLIERPEGDAAFAFLLVLGLHLEAWPEGEDENDENKKPSSPANWRMKAFSEFPSAHAKRAGLILLLTEKLAESVDS
jgi:hypothetical protein